MINTLRFACARGAGASRRRGRAKLSGAAGDDHLQCRRRHQPGCGRAGRLPSGCRKSGDSRWSWSIARAAAASSRPARPPPPRPTATRSTWRRPRCSRCRRKRKPRRASISIATSSKIGLVNEQPLIFAAAAKLGINTLPEFIAFAKAKPGDVLYAGNTRGSLPHLATELLSSRTGIQMTFVPYPAIPPALHDMMGGRIGMIVQSLSSLAGAIDGGAIKPLAVASQKRLAQAAECADRGGNRARLRGARLVRADGACQDARRHRRQSAHRPAHRARSERGGAAVRGARRLHPSSVARASSTPLSARERQLWRSVVKQVGVTSCSIPSACNKSAVPALALTPSHIVFSRRGPEWPS